MGIHGVCGSVSVRVMWTAEVCHNAAVLLQVLDAVLRSAVAKHSAAKVCEGVLVNECGTVSMEKRACGDINSIALNTTFCNTFEVKYPVNDVH